MAPCLTIALRFPLRIMGSSSLYAEYSPLSRRWIEQPTLDACLGFSHPPFSAVTFVCAVEFTVYLFWCFIFPFPSASLLFEAVVLSLLQLFVVFITSLCSNDTQPSKGKGSTISTPYPSQLHMCPKGQTETKPSEQLQLHLRIHTQVVDIFAQSPPCHCVTLPRSVPANWPHLRACANVRRGITTVYLCK